MGLLTLLAAAAVRGRPAFRAQGRFRNRNGGGRRAEDARSEMEGMPARDITLHRPVVRFQTAQGQMIQFTASFVTGAPLYVVGEQVQVLYPGGMPSKARIQHPGLRWGAPLLLALMGMGFCLIAACVHRLCVRYWPILFGPRDGACG